MCSYLCRTVAEFNGDCNFEGTSTVSNYGTASESDEWISISVSISISIIPGFTTSLKMQLSQIDILSYQCGMN